MKTLINGGYVVSYDGREHKIIRDGRVVGVDQKELMERVQEQSERIRDAFPQYDWQGRSINQMFAPSFEFAEHLSIDL